MRRFFTVSFIVLALVVSAAGVAPTVARAQTTTGGAPLTTQNGGTVVEGLGGEIDEAAKKAATKKATEEDRAKNATWGFDWVMSKIAGLFAWLVGTAALTLNYAVYYCVINMGQYINGLSAVGTVWEILRDIGNILLIFGFLAVGISIIIDSEWYGGGKKLLPTLLAAAVFTNFSLFAAEAVIDVNNLFATQIYKQINQGTLPNPSDEGFSKIIQNKGVAGVLMNSLGLQTVYERANPDSGNGKSSLAPGKAWYVGFMSIILFIVTAFVMFALAFIIIARFVKLIYLIIISPIGVAGLAVPYLAGYARQWWSDLFKQAITAPVLFLMLYIALRVITDEHFIKIAGGTKPDWTGFFTDATLSNFGGVLLSFIVAIGLMLAVVIVAKNLSAFGASWATKTAGKLSFGATALGMRTTVGWGANRAAKYLQTTRIARIPLAGTSLVRGLNKAGGASFDVRGAKIGGGLHGAGVDAGTAQKGGYKADLKARTESRTKYAADLKGRELNEEEKIQQAMLQRDVVAMEKQQQRRKIQQAKNVEENKVDPVLNTQIEHAGEALKQRKAKLDTLESVTDKGAKLEYAKALNLGMDEKNTFNKYFNFAANTDAAKKIREEAKKSKDDQMLDQFKKALKKAGLEEEPPMAAPGGAAAGGAAPTGGAPAH